MTPGRLPERIEKGDLVIRLWSPDDATAMSEMITDSLEHLRPWMAWAAAEPRSGLHGAIIRARHPDHG